MQAKKQEEVKAVQRFTGLCSFQVVAVNPTLEDLNALGATYIQQEPVYTSDKGLRLDFWLENKIGQTYVDGDGNKQNSGPLLIKTSIFLENANKVAGTGKVRFINDYLQNSWANEVNDIYENANMSWFSQNHNTRAAKVGELELLTFFQKLLGLSLGIKGKNPDEVKFNTSWSSIVGGNLTELRGYIRDAIKAGNGLTFCLGVKSSEDGKTYQTVYMDYIQSAANKTTKFMQNALTERTPTNFDYQNSLEFKLYTGTSTSSTPTPDSSKKEEAAF